MTQSWWRVQGLSFKADVSSEDAEVVEAGKARLRQALKVRITASLVGAHRFATAGANAGVPCVRSSPVSSGRGTRDRQA